MAKKTAPGIDITKLIKKDHGTLRRLFAQFEETNDRAAKRRKAIADTVAEVLGVHLRLEEEVFHATLAGARSKDARRLAGEAREEHGLLKLLLPQIAACGVGAPELVPKMKLLKDLVARHARAVERASFAEARAACSDAQLTELGGRYEARRNELERAEARAVEAPPEGRGNRRAPPPEEGAWEPA